MTSAQTLIGVLVAIVIAIVGIFLVTHRTPPSYGTAAPSGSISFFTAIGTKYGLYIGDYSSNTQVIDDNGNFSSTGTATFGTFTQGGGVTASSTSASVTLAGTEFTTSNVLDYTVNVGSVTLTLMASTSPPCSVMSSSQTRDVLIRNATTTATSKITIAGGTGNLLKTASTTVIAGNTDGSDFAKLIFTKKANTDCGVLMTNFN